MCRDWPKTIQLKIDYMAAQAEYATWSATKTRGDFDIRTFEVKARPVKTNRRIASGNDRHGQLGRNKNNRT